MTKIVAIIKTDPIITGKSKVFNAFTISFPRPFQPKTYSTKTAPANNDAHQPEIAVTTGLIAFFRACFKSTCFALNPLASAVLINS